MHIASVSPTDNIVRNVIPINKGVFHILSIILGVPKLINDLSSIHSFVELSVAESIFSQDYGRTIVQLKYSFTVQPSFSSSGVFPGPGLVFADFSDDTGFVADSVAVKGAQVEAYILASVNLLLHVCSSLFTLSPWLDNTQVETDKENDRRDRNTNNLLVQIHLMIFCMGYLEFSSGILCFEQCGFTYYLVLKTISFNSSFYRKNNFLYDLINSVLVDAL